MLVEIDLMEFYPGHIAEQQPVFIDFQEYGV
jgi:hypothetical protein